MKIFISIVVVVIIAATVFAFRGFLVSQINYDGSSDIETATPKTTPSEFSMLFAGDMMLDRSVKKKIIEIGGDDWRFPFLRIAEYTRAADFTMANLEGPVSSRGVKIGSIYSFRFDPASLEGLKFAGIDMVTLANNHIFDYGQLAFADSMSNLANAGIDYVGIGENFERAHQGVTRNIRGTKVTFLGYTDFYSQQLAATVDKAGIAFLEREQMEEDIRAAKSRSDLVVVNVHKGDEYHTNHNASQEIIYKAAIDAGADLVVGHHPHVVQEIEKYNNGWIAYSLGNFVFDQDFSEETMRGIFLKVIIQNKKIASVDSVPYNISSSFQPYLP